MWLWFLRLFASLSFFTSTLSSSVYSVSFCEGEKLQTLTHALVTRNCFVTCVTILKFREYSLRRTTAQTKNYTGKKFSES